MCVAVVCALHPPVDELKWARASRVVFSSLCPRPAETAVSSAFLSFALSLSFFIGFSAIFHQRSLQIWITSSFECHLCVFHRSLFLRGRSPVFCVSDNTIPYFWPTRYIVRWPFASSPHTSHASCISNVNVSTQPTIRPWAVALNCFFLANVHCACFESTESFVLGTIVSSHAKSTNYYFIFRLSVLLVYYVGDRSWLLASASNTLYQIHNVNLCDLCCE